MWSRSYSSFSWNKCRFVQITQIGWRLRSHVYLVSSRKFLGDREAHRLSQRNCKQIGLSRSLAYISPQVDTSGRFPKTRSADAVTILASLSGTVGECRWVSRGGFVRGWRRGGRFDFDADRRAKKGTRGRSSEEKRSLSDVTAGIDADIPVNCARYCWCGVFVIPVVLAIRFMSLVGHVTWRKEITEQPRKT